MNAGSNGRLDFLKLPALAFELSREYFTEDLHCTDPLFGIGNAPRDGNISWHTCLTLIGIMGTASI